MKQTDENNRASRLLHEFENLENIQPTAEWEQTLFAKMTSSHPGNADQGKGLKYAVLVAGFLLINAFFFLELNNPGTSQSTQRYDALKSISNELLINPTASK